MPSVRLIGVDSQEIVDLEGWFAHAPPAGGASQWVDCFSAKEQAKAWLRTGTPKVPDEILHAVVAGGLDADTWTGYPEHKTAFDSYHRGQRGVRNHDMLILLGDPNDPAAVIGVEAKAGEDFDGDVRDKVGTPAPTNLPKRCNLLSRALFGRDVCHADTAAITDTALADHGYQLWTGAIGAVVEAQRRGATRAALLVHQFVPGAAPCPTEDKRSWQTLIPANARKIGAFKQALGPTPTTFATTHVAAGTSLTVITAVSPMHPTAV